MTPQDRAATLDTPAGASRMDAAPVQLGAARVVPVFTIVFALVYFYGVWTNDGIIRFYANVNELHFSPQAPALGPAMFWYGWLVNGLVAGLVASAAALFAPRRWFDGRWQAWAWAALAVPVGLIAWLFWLLREYFTQ